MPLLRAGDKRRIADHGFTVLRDAVPESLRHEALRTINELLGRGIRGISPGCYSNEYWREIINHASILDLFYKSSLFRIAEQLLGQGKVAPVSESHILLRFPQRSKRGEEIEFHIDGILTSDDPDTAVIPSRLRGSIPSLKLGVIQRYTMQFCVLLADVPSENCGNFAVVPGSHRVAQKFIQERGVDALGRGLFSPAPQTPLQIRARAGDAVLCHYLTMHAGRDNFSPNIRYAVFFRVHHVDYLADPEAALQDMWLEWPGLRRAQPVR